MILLCSDCNKYFNTRKERGYKLKPKILCQVCNLKNQTVTCHRCEKTFTLKEGGLDECWECKEEGCIFCLNKVEMEGLEFYFCNKHKNYNKNKLKREALELIKEVQKWN